MTIRSKNHLSGYGRKKPPPSKFKMLWSQTKSSIDWKVARRVFMCCLVGVVLTAFILFFFGIL